jgi:hypothetical protein
MFTKNYRNYFFLNSSGTKDIKNRDNKGKYVYQLIHVILDYECIMQNVC